MNNNIKYLKYIVTLALFTPQALLYAYQNNVLQEIPVQQVTSAQSNIRKAEDVFSKWLAWQKVHQEHDFASLSATLTETKDFCQNLKKTYEANLHLLTSLAPTLKVLTGNQINEHGYAFTIEKEPLLKNNFSNLYQQIDSSMSTFVRFLKQTGYDCPGNSYLDQSLAFSTLLFPSSTKKQQDDLVFSFANKIFNFCFEDETFFCSNPCFKQMLLDVESLAVNRFLYTTMWYFLAGNGWHDWSKTCLEKLKREADQGKTITYIAGGSDIYQLIKHGIYNINIIDPQLPSQPKYYTNDWEWIMHGNGPDGGIGDQIVFENNDGIITMTRTSFQKTGKQFRSYLADRNAMVLLEASLTEWEITNELGEKLGSYTLERRCCTQDDFKTSPDKALLISFNELFYIALSDAPDGWHINPTLFDQNMNLFVKQLHKPVAKSTICNMHMASLINITKEINQEIGSLMRLGTCIN